jgi:hypothetical protein
LSEEHGHLAVDATPLAVGQQIELVPTHSDTTINLHDWMFGLRGDRVEEVFRIEGRGKFQGLASWHRPAISGPYFTAIKLHAI